MQLDIYPKNPEQFCTSFHKVKESAIIFKVFGLVFGLVYSLVGRFDLILKVCLNIINISTLFTINFIYYKLLRMAIINDNY